MKIPSHAEPNSLKFSGNFRLFMLRGIAVVLAWGWSASCNDLLAQPPGSHSSGPSHADAGSSHDAQIKRPKAAAGGNSMADFDSLINLIQTVVDAEWGIDDTMTPFAGGIWVDPQGVLQTHPSREDRYTARQVAAANQRLAAAMGETHSPSELRWVDLNQFFAAAGGGEETVAQSVPATTANAAAWTVFGSLQRIDYLRFDPQTEHWLIGGPAGRLHFAGPTDITGELTGLPPVLATDAVAIAEHVLNGRGVFGCSIDPESRRLAETDRWVRLAANRRLLASEPQIFLGELRTRLGRQNIRIFGLPAEHPTALAILAADVHMKRLAFEQAGPPPASLTSYWQASRRLGTQPQSLCRWWFALDPQGIVQVEAPPHQTDLEQEAAPELAGRYYWLPGRSVRVLSEGEFVDQAGRRQAAAAADPAADLFADSFTAAFADLSRRYPVYGRLQHVFDLTCVFEVIRRSGQSDPRMQLSPSSVAKFYRRQPPMEIDTLVALDRTAAGSISAVASGGVQVDPAILQVSSIAAAAAARFSAPAVDREQVEAAYNRLFDSLRTPEIFP